MLARSFPTPQNMDTLTLPLTCDHKTNQNDDNWLNTRLVSSLRQHTQWKHSPAFGHQARNNSTASLWPERDDALSRESLLAEQVSLNRRLRQREDGAAKESIDTKRRRHSELSGEEPERRRFLPSRYRRRLKSASSHRVLTGLSGPRSEALNPYGRVEQKNVLKAMRGLRVRTVSDDGHRWSLEPVLRSEDHPVFVQPVKEFVIKRWRVFRSGRRSRSSIFALSEGTGKRLDYQRAASSISRDSSQLSRRTQITTMIQGSGLSLGQQAPDNEAPSRASAGREQILTSAEASQDSTNHAQTTTRSEPLIAIECSDEDLPMESTDYCPSTELGPRHSLRFSESGQTRNRTSTSGTTVYNSPLIAEASPNSKKLESDGSTSSGTSCSMRDLNEFLHEGEIASASE